MDHHVMKEHPARSTDDMRRDPGNRREAPSRRLAPRLCAAVLVFAAAAAMLAGCNDDKTLTETINRALQKTSIPGAIVGVWREGQPPYVRTFGVSNTATGEPMAADLYMRIGSNTKTFVITSILILADRGKLSLDDPIDLYVEGVPSGGLIDHPPAARADAQRALRLLQRHHSEHNAGALPGMDAARAA